MAISIAMYAPRLVNPITQFVFWICFFCVSHPWLVTWHCMYSRLYHIMRFIKFNDMFTQKTSLSQETLSIFELVIFETLIVIEHKESKSTILTMITYIGEHREHLYIHFFSSERYIQLGILMIVCVKSTKNQWQHVAHQMQWNLECIACTTSQADRLKISHQFTKWSNDF